MKRTLLLICLSTICAMTLVAQTDAPAASKVIYTNLGKKTEPYFTGSGGVLLSSSNFLAMPFTPKSNSHVSEVQVAVQYYSGANQVNLSIYGDSSGVPGTLLAGPVTVTNLPSTGTCCALAVANFSPVGVTGGTQYWVVADTQLTGTGSDFVGGWREVVKPAIPFGYNRGKGWNAGNADTLVAGEVLGTIP